MQICERFMFVYLKRNLHRIHWRYESDEVLEDALQLTWRLVYPCSIPGKKNAMLFTNADSLFGNVESLLECHARLFQDEVMIWTASRVWL